MKKIALIMIIALTIGLAAMPAWSQSPWTQFQQNGAHTGYVELAGSPDAWLKWSYVADGSIINSPVLGHYGTIYIGTIGSFSKIYAVGFNGFLRWSYQLSVNVFSTPAVADDGTIFVGDMNRLVALNSDGTLKWQYSTGGWVMSSVTIGADGNLYFGCADSKIYCITQGGSTVWKYETDDAVYAAPAVTDSGIAYAGSLDNFLYAINSDGTLLWSYETGDIIASSPAIDENGNIYFASKDQKLYSLSSAGSVNWSFNIGGESRCSPGIAPSGTIYCGSANGVMYAIDATTGLKDWQYNTGGEIISSPAIDLNENIYFGSRDGKAYCLDKDGHLLWSYETGDEVWSSPAIGPEQYIFFGSKDHKLYALKKFIPTPTSTPTTTPTFTPTITETPTVTPTVTGTIMTATPTATPTGEGPLFFVEVSPNPFSPDGDGFQDTTLFTMYGNAEPPEDMIENISLSILSADQELLRRWTYAGQYEYFSETQRWDGTDDMGAQLAAGEYFWQLKGKDVQTGVWGYADGNIVLTGDITPTPRATPTTTPTATRTPHPTSTPTPFNYRPKILMAGYLGTQITSQSGGYLDLVAWTSDADGTVEEVEVWYQGSPTGLKLPELGGSQGIYWLSDVFIEPGIPPVELLIELKATDDRGGISYLWPFLEISEGEGGDKGFGSGADLFAVANDWRILYDLAVIASSRGGDAPNILAAGYFDTELSEDRGGILRILAAVSDPQGLGNIMEVQLYFAGQPAGLYFFDDGYHGDFARGDGVYGLSIAFGRGDLEGASGAYLLEIRARDLDGNQSHLWPYLTIE